MNANDALCHQCRNARVRVYGMQCAPCQEVTNREYWAERKRRGGKLLYLEGSDLSRVAAGLREDDGMIATRMCGECTKEFEWTPGIGRPPLRCPDCRAGHSQANGRSPKHGIVQRQPQRITPASLPARVTKSPQEIADALTERVLSVVDAFNLDFNLGNCLRLMLQRETDRPENERADLVWARKYLDRAIARLSA